MTMQSGGIMGLPPLTIVKIVVFEKNKERVKRVCAYVLKRECGVCSISTVESSVGS